MAEENATCTYRMNQPFARALKSVRTALAGANVRIAGELDLSVRISRALLVDIPPCTVLFAAPSTPAAREPAADSCDAVLTPLHVVVSARGFETEVHFLRALPRFNGPLGQLQGSLFHAIEKIAMRSLDA